MKVITQRKHGHFLLVLIAIITFSIGVNIVIKAAAMCETDDLLCGSEP